MVHLTIDGRKVEAGSEATILDVFRVMGVDVPTLCHLDRAEPFASCMVCSVWLADEKRMAPACSTRVREGMIVESGNEAVRDFRKTAIELILADHVGDCEGPCRQVCPVGLDVPGLMRLVELEEFRQSWILIRDHLPFPRTLTGICPAPCQRACRRGQVDDGLDIPVIKQALGELFAGERGEEEKIADDFRGRVLVKGNGLSGLAVAYFLRRLGIQCLVVDERHEPGGGLLQIIGPDEKKRRIFKTEIEYLEQMGIEFCFGPSSERYLDWVISAREFDALVVTDEVGRLDLPLCGQQSASFPGRELDRGRFLYWEDRLVFVSAGSDTGPGMLRAVADARNVADDLGRRLTGNSVETRQKRFCSRVGRLTDAERESLRCYSGPPQTALAANIGRQRVIERPREMVEEAGRCLHCECLKENSCDLRRLATEYGADSRKFRRNQRPALIRMDMRSDLVFEPGKCVRCGKCVRLGEMLEDPLGMTFIGRGFDMRVGPPLGTKTGEALPLSAGVCLAACPSGALSIKRRTAVGEARPLSLDQAAETEATAEPVDVNIACG